MDLYKNWWEEKRSAYLYSIIAEKEKNIRHKKLFTDLQTAAEKQAAVWENKIQKKGLAPPQKFIPDKRTRLVVWLLKWFGVENIQHVLSAMKIRGMSIFSQYHTERKHTSLNATSNLRAAVFGINDGLVSNMSLILGIAGAKTDYYLIILAGVAGLLAGACSMGAGEYISVRSQREVFEYQIAIEKQELEEYPEEEAEELSLIYQARGIPKEDAEKLAKFMVANPERGLDALAREELGINPDELVSPMSAMVYSFLSFSVGAAIPLIPFFFGNHPWNLPASMIITGLTLFGIGSVLSLFTNRNPILLGLRMLAVGVIAGAFTYGIGSLLGIAMY